MAICRLTIFNEPRRLFLLMQIVSKSNGDKIFREHVKFTVNSRNRGISNTLGLTEEIERRKVIFK